jgi:hypothetical protein
MVPAAAMGVTEADCVEFSKRAEQLGSSLCGCRTDFVYPSLDIFVTLDALAAATSGTWPVLPCMRRPATWMTASA